MSVINPFTDFNRGLLKDADTGNHILASCALTSSAAITAAGGTVVGTPTIGTDGYTPSANNYVHFSGLTNYGKLDHAGQILLRVTTQDIAERDDDATYVSLSNGLALAAAQYLITGKSATPSNEAFMYISTANQLTCKMNSGDTSAVGGVTSRGKDATTDIILWWEGTKYGVFANGRSVFVGTKTALVTNSWQKIALGVGFTYTLGTQMFTGKISYFAVSTQAPTFAYHPKLTSIEVNGDSYAAQFNQQTVPRFDTTIANVILNKLANLGLTTNITVNGYPGATVCDTGANDLNTNISLYGASQSQVTIFLGFNNDATLSAANWTTYALNATTGSDARIKDFINAADPTTDLIYVATPRSLKQDASLDSTNTTTQRDSLITIVEALPAWWDAANPTATGKVVVLPLFDILGGDQTVNYNYIGQADLDGNGYNTPALDNAHPFTDGVELLGAWIFNDLLQRRLLS